MRDKIPISLRAAYKAHDVIHQFPAISITVFTNTSDLYTLYILTIAEARAALIQIADALALHDAAEATRHEPPAVEPDAMRCDTSALTDTF